MKDYQDITTKNNKLTDEQEKEVQEIVKLIIEEFERYIFDSSYRIIRLLT